MRPRFTEEQVHFICRYFEQNRDKSFDYIYYTLLYFLNLQEDTKLRKRIRKLYSRDPSAFPYITSQYNY
jgi:hypothetical protein